MTSTNHQPNAKTNSIQSHNFILGYKCVDELNRFVAQRQKELFTKTDVLCALVNITMSHDINFVYFGVFNLQIDASMSFSWILGPVPVN